MIGNAIYPDKIIVDKMLYWKFGFVKSIIIQLIESGKQHSYTGTVKDMTKDLQIFDYMEVWRALNELKKDGFVSMKDAQGYKNRYIFNGMEGKRKPPKKLAAIVKRIEELRKEKNSK